MNRRPCLCTKKILLELNSFHMLKLSFILSKSQSCWPRDWKWSILKRGSALTNWALKTLTLGAGQFVEFILTRERNETRNDDVNCGNTNLCEDMIVAVGGNCTLRNCKVTRKKFRDFNGIRTHGLWVRAAVLLPIELWRPINWEQANFVNKRLLLSLSNIPPSIMSFHRVSISMGS